MGLKIIADGAFGTGKTAFATTLAEMGNIGACDTEQRWQFYTIPHPTERPRKEAPAALIEALIGPTPGLPDSKRAELRKAWANVYVQAYAFPRQIRQDVPWLPKTLNVVWLLQSMDPIAAWNVTKVWATDESIVGFVKDSASVYWDILQDLKDPDEKLGGLAWAPIKRTDRRMTYTLLKSAKHWIITAHTQEKMNAKMEVTSRVPWVEKKNPHWADICLRFHFQPEDVAPRAEVVREKVAGGAGGALKQGKVIKAPTFKQVMALTGVVPGLVQTDMASMEEIEARAKAAITRVRDSAYQPGVDNNPQEESK